ncbi:rhamnose/proton symporter RhaT, partial [Clostridium perfringens]
MIYGFLLLLAASLFQGSFGLGMKKYQPFSWEAFWVVFSVIGILLIPAGWTWLEVPA